MSKIDYDLTRIRAIAFDVDGVLSPCTVPMADDGTPARMVNVKDGYALKTAVSQGIAIAIISGADQEALRKRFAALHIDEVHLCASMKLPVLKDWMERLGLTADEVAFVGDDIPDFHAMEFVGLPVAPADADVEIRRKAVYVTDARGGYGVARELIEEVLRAQGKWMRDFSAYGWTNS